MSEPTIQCPKCGEDFIPATAQQRQCLSCRYGRSDAVKAGVAAAREARAERKALEREAVELEDTRAVVKAEMVGLEEARLAGDAVAAKVALRMARLDAKIDKVHGTVEAYLDWLRDKVDNGDGLARHEASFLLQYEKAAAPLLKEKSGGEGTVVLQDVKNVNLLAAGAELDGGGSR